MKKILLNLLIFNSLFLFSKSFETAKTLKEEISKDKLSYYGIFEDDFGEKFSFFGIKTPLEENIILDLYLVSKIENKQTKFEIAFVWHEISNSLIFEELNEKGFPKVKKIKYKFDDDSSIVEDFDKFWEREDLKTIKKKNFSKNDYFFKKIITSKKLKFQVIGYQEKSKIFEFDLKDFQEMWEKHKNEF